MKLIVSGLALALCASSFALTFTGPGIAASTWIEGDPNVVGANFSDIVVTGTGATVSSIDSVTLTNFNHTWAGDLEVALYNVENDVFVDLFSPSALASSNLNGTYTFVVDPSLSTVDEALDGKGSAYILPGGNYAISTYGGGDLGPRESFDAFSGIALDGTWELLVADFESGDQGSLGSWTLNATPQAVPEPASMAALGLGAVAVLRRRKKA